MGKHGKPYVVPRKHNQGCARRHHGIAGVQMSDARVGLCVEWVMVLLKKSGRGGKTELFTCSSTIMLSVPLLLAWLDALTPVLEATMRGAPITKDTVK